MTHKLILFVAIFLIQCSVIAQSKTQQLDSLLKLLPSQKEDTVKVNLLNRISNIYPYINPDEGIRIGTKALELSAILKWKLGVANSNLAVGANYARKEDFSNALKYDFKALRLFEELKNEPMQAIMLQNLALVFNYAKDYQQAINYNLKALKKYRELRNTLGIATIYGNMANVYYRLDSADKVIEYDMKALMIYQQGGHRQDIARIKGNIANFYAERAEFHDAMQFYFEAIAMERELGNGDGETRNLGNIGETYFDIAVSEKAIAPDKYIPAGKSANLKLAISYLERTIQKAKEIGQISYEQAYSEVLAKAYEMAGNSAAALRVYKNYIQNRDSIFNIENLEAANRERMEYEYSKKEDSLTFQRKVAEVSLEAEKTSRVHDRYFYIAGLIVVIGFLIVMIRKNRNIQAQKRLVELEQRRSEELLLNILPAETAEELKLHGAAKAKDFDQVSIMFTDFKNFTQLSEKLTAQELVNEINFCYSVFDTIIGKHKIEKIKTIGDAYMCAGGLPVANKTNAYDTVQAAIEIRDFMLNEKRKREKKGKQFFEIRIGVHTGPVVAGIVGIKKFAYDIWGDAVNTAARMESSGEVGKVNISGSTYELIKDKFHCEYRGKIEAKNKGEIDMYFVERI